MNRWFAKLLQLVSVVALAAACGQTTLKCGEGTFKNGGACVGYDPSDETAPVTTVDVAGVRSRSPIPGDVTLTTNEPARVYYTVDGSEPTLESTNEPPPVLVPHIEQGTTVKFFAVDPAGNQEATQTHTYIQDLVPPAQISGVNVVAAGTAATLSWTNPTDPDFEGVLVAIVTDPVYLAAPEAEAFYTPGMALSSGLDVVIAGAETELTLDGFTPGARRHVVAWTYDDLGNYSSGRLIRAVGDVGSLAGGISVDVAGLGVTVSSQPTSLTLSGTASYSAGTSTLTVALGVQNDTARSFQNPKVVVTSVSTGAFAGDCLAGVGMPCKSFGPETLVPAAMLTKNLTFTGVGPADTVNFTAALVESPTIVGGGRSRPRASPGSQQHHGVDAATGVFHPNIAIDASMKYSGNSGPLGVYNSAVTSPDGRYLFVGGTMRAQVGKIDLATRTFVGGALLYAGRGKVEVFGNDLALYALVKEYHRQSSGAPDLVRLDYDLNEIARIDLGTSPGYSRHRPALSPAGEYIAVPLPGELRIYDAWTFDLVATFEADDPRMAVFSRDGQTVYTADRDGSSITAIDLPTGVVTEIPYAGGRRFDLYVDAQDRLWIASDDQLAAYDPSSGEVATLDAYPGPANAFAEADGEIYVLRSNRAQLDHVDSTGAILSTWNIGDTWFAHWLDVVDN